MAEYGYGSGVGIISVTLSRLTDLLSKTEFVSKDVENSKPRYRDETPEFELLSDKAL